MSKPTSDLLSILQAGGGIAIPATKPTNDLVELARAAARAGTYLVLKNVQKPTADCERIAEAGAGHVILEFE